MTQTFASVEQFRRRHIADPLAEIRDDFGAAWQAASGGRERQALLNAVFEAASEKVGGNTDAYEAFVAEVHERYVDPPEAYSAWDPGSGRTFTVDEMAETDEHFRAVVDAVRGAADAATAHECLTVACAVDPETGPVHDWTGAQIELLAALGHEIVPDDSVVTPEEVAAAGNESLADHLAGYDPAELAEAAGDYQPGPVRAAIDAILTGQTTEASP